VYAPSRSVFRHCLSLDRDRKSGADSEVVLIDGTANLPSAREELVYLSGLYNGRTRVLEAEDLPQFSSAVAGCGILHFSGHAVSGQDNPALMLRKFPDTTYLDSGEIGSWKLSRCRLVNLAGCSTGVGPVAEGESPWGLVPAFLNAGAPAIVASLMQVDDSATTQLSRRFYESLQEGNDKATALRKAQLAILDRSSKDAGSLSWVPYILIGNPQ
jgi:CHAT domain-containing protein